MLVLARRPNQGVIITIGGRRCRVIIVGVREGTVRLGIEAPPDVSVTREEIAGTERDVPSPRRRAQPGFGEGLPS